VSRDLTSTLKVAAVPVVGVLALAFAWTHHPHGLGFIVLLAILMAAVLTAVSHAEVIAHRVGEPLGALVLALCVTVIEASLIISMMFSHHGEGDTVARDTVFAAVMIVCNGVVGISILANTRRHQVARFQKAGTNALLATVIALASLALVLPAFTTSKHSPTFSHGQLVYSAVASLAIYAVFLFTQVIRHSDDFQALTVTGSVAVVAGDDDGGESAMPTTGATWISVGLLLISLIVVVGLAHVLSIPLEEKAASIGLPQAVVGLGIALLVLLPETLAAVRAARDDRMQTSLNLSLGSAIASIGLTIPTVAVAAIVLHHSITLALGPQDLILFAITAVIASITLSNGEATILQGAIHVVIFSAFVYVAFVPL
jgi:Ca2+:H+ antiporter